MPPPRTFITLWEQAVKLSFSSMVLAYGAAPGVYESPSMQSRAFGLYAVCPLSRPVPIFAFAYPLFPYVFSKSWCVTLTPTPAPIWASLFRQQNVTEELNLPNGKPRVFYEVPAFSDIPPYPQL